MVVVSCGDVHTESHSAGADTVQAQGRSVVEREQAFAELEAAKKFAENVDVFSEINLPSFTPLTLYYIQPHFVHI